MLSKFSWQSNRRQMCLPNRDIIGVWPRVHLVEEIVNWTGFCWCAHLEIIFSLLSFDGGNRVSTKLVRNFGRPESNCFSANCNSFLSVGCRHNQGDFASLPQHIKPSQPNEQTNITPTAPGTNGHFMEPEEDIVDDSNRISQSRLSFHSAMGEVGSRAARCTTTPKPLSRLSSPTPHRDPLWHTNRYSSHAPTEKTAATDDPSFVVPPHLIIAPAQKLEGWRLVIVEIW